jgi:hypothetical protein
MAAPSSGLPGAPTSVQVSGAGDGATLTWNPPRSGAAPTGWRVTVRPSERQTGGGVEQLPATARSDRFGSIRAGVTYSFSVRATSARGTGPEVRVRYTAPRTTVSQSLFAIDASGALLRYPTSGTGAPRTVLTSGAAGYTADDIGDVFVPSADGKSILLVPSGGGAPRVLATGLHVSQDLRSDVEGNLYWVDSVSGAIVKLPVKGAAKAILPSAGTFWAVGRDGTVSAWTASGTTAGTVASVSPRGVVTTRTVVPTEGNSIGYAVGLLADGHGNLYLGVRSPGGSYYNSWYALRAGSSSTTSLGVPTRYQYSAANQDALVLGQSAGWCPAISESSPVNPCVADHTVTNLVSVDGSGTVTTGPATSGLQVPSNGIFVGAADTAGDLFVNAPERTPGLWRVPATGGAAQQLSTGQSTRLLVI